MKIVGIILLVLGFTVKLVEVYTDYKFTKNMEETDKEYKKILEKLEKIYTDIQEE